MKFPLISLLAFSLPLFSAGQTEKEDSKNIVLSNVSRTFRFVKGNKEHPVQVNEESRRTYYCNSYRSDVQVVEFYNDNETIDDLGITVNGSKKHGITPKYEYYSSSGIFYSDAHVCYFNLPLAKQGSSSEVTFRKTYLDPRYFSTIYFSDQQPIQQQEISIVVPSWMSLDIKEFNLSKYKITKNVSDGKGDEKVYTFTMNNLPAMPDESQSPGFSYYAPHIMVLCRQAQPADEKYTYFTSVKEQYKWYKGLVDQVGNDVNVIREKTEEITKGLGSDEAKVKAVFQWVQDNIRYIAFENGIAGFKPEKGQVVLSKKYGDCKGMANLLTEMLKSIKLDARRCWIGTKHIAYDYSTPSLAVDNHMICAWMYKGKPVFLDGTEKYIGYGEVAERIQGRPVLIENGNDYILAKVPEASHLQNTSTETRKLTIDGNDLKGHVTQTWKGESKEWFLSELNDVKKNKQEDALKDFLSGGKPNFQISNLKVGNISDYNADLNVEYDVNWKDALSVFGKETYADVDNRHNWENTKIDTAKRKLALWFPFKADKIFDTEINLPADRTVTTLPQKVTIKQKGYGYTAGYSSVPGKLLYRTEVIIDQTEVKPEDFSQWNRDNESLTKFYNEQIVITHKN